MVVEAWAAVPRAATQVGAATAALVGREAGREAVEKATAAEMAMVAAARGMAAEMVMVAGARGRATAAATANREYWEEAGAATGRAAVPWRRQRTGNSCPSPRFRRLRR